MSTYSVRLAGREVCEKAERHDAISIAQLAARNGTRNVTVWTKARGKLVEKVWPDMSTKPRSKTNEH